MESMFINPSSIRKATVFLVQAPSHILQLKTVNPVGALKSAGTPEAAVAVLAMASPIARATVVVQALIGVTVRTLWHQCEADREAATG